MTAMSNFRGRVVALRPSLVTRSFSFAEGQPIMPAQTPVTYATLSGGLPSKPYILEITPSSSSPHLLLRHPSTDITIADNQSLQPIDVFKGAHTGHITAVRSEEGAVWSSGKDSNIVRWDERSRRAGTTIKGQHGVSLARQRLTCSFRP